MTNNGVKCTDTEGSDTLGVPETIGILLCLLSVPIVVIGFILKLIVDIFAEKPDSLAERALYDLTPGVGAYSLMTAAVTFAKAWKQRHTMTWSLYFQRLAEQTRSTGDLKKRNGVNFELLLLILFLAIVF